MKRKIAVLLAAVLLGIAVMPGVLASADEVEISAPSAVLMEASTGKAVSYTHLDVYKRQGG